MHALMFIMALFATEPEAAKVPPVDPATVGSWLEVKISGQLDNKPVEGDVLLYTPPGYYVKGAKRYPLVLALHGWDHTPALFREKGNLAALADQYGFVVAIPDTGRTIFETAFYKETRGKWTKAPGAPYVGEVVLPWLREHLRVAQDKAGTAVIGYSTGGRGAVLLAELYPEFAFAGSVSGTFDLMGLDPKTGEYRIHQIIYGKRDKFPERWQKDTNIRPELIAKLNGTSVYAAHGDKDKSVPVLQLEALVIAMAGSVPTLETAITKGGTHDWPVWNEHFTAMFQRFDRVRRH